MKKLIKSLKNTGIYRFIRKSGKHLRKVVKRFFLRRKLDKGTPVFIYQMAKVASSSVYHSLEKQYPGALGAAHHIGSDNWHSELFYDLYKQDKPIKIICPVREPIGRNISHFFEQFIKHVGVPYEESTLSTEELIKVFMEKYNHDHPLVWLDNNIKKHFGIDVYNTPFPSNGVATYTSNNVELLIFRIDIDDSTKEGAIRDFLNFPSFKLENYNVGQDKDYKETYRKFKNSIKLPDDYLSKMKNSKYFNHFFTKKEIDKTIKHWKQD